MQVSIDSPRLTQ